MVTPLLFHCWRCSTKQWKKIVEETPIEPVDFSPAEAMHREREMNSRVSRSGDDSEWHQHQYVMASTGNVDSARILLEYGVFEVPAAAITCTCGTGHSLLPVTLLLFGACSLHQRSRRTSRPGRRCSGPRLPATLGLLKRRSKQAKRASCCTR